MALITVEEAAAHLRLDLETDGGSPAEPDARLPDLESKIAEAEAAILNYIEMDEEDLSATGVDAKWLPIVQSAVKLYLTGLWDDRVGGGNVGFEAGGDYFKEDGAIARLLRRIRYPAIA